MMLQHLDKSLANNSSRAKNTYGNFFGHEVTEFYISVNCVPLAREQ